MIMVIDPEKANWGGGGTAPTSPPPADSIGDGPK